MARLASYIVCAIGGTYVLMGTLALMGICVLTIEGEAPPLSDCLKVLEVTLLGGCVSLFSGVWLQNNTIKGDK